MASWIGAFDTLARAFNRTNESASVLVGCAALHGAVVVSEGRELGRGGTLDAFG